MSAVLVGQVWEHPLDGTQWEVQATDLSVTKLSHGRSGLPALLWVNTPALPGTWRCVAPPAGAPVPEEGT